MDPVALASMKQNFFIKYLVFPSQMNYSCSWPVHYKPTLNWITTRLPGETSAAVLLIKFKYAFSKSLPNYSRPHAVALCNLSKFCSTADETGEHILQVNYQVPFVATYVHPTEVAGRVVARVFPSG